MLQKIRVAFAIVMLSLAMIASHSLKAVAQATQVPPAEACFQATTGITGMIGSLGLITGGYGGASGATFAGIPLTGGTGSGATANIVITSGFVASVTIINPGISYTAGDVLSAAVGVTGFSVPVASTSINSSLAGGTVGMYTVGTLTAKQTWQNANQTTLNTNPITLDANGCAVIYGVGTYRQILYDSLGNEVWDKPTSVAPVNPYFAGTASGSANVISVTDGSFSQTDGQSISFFAANTNTGPTTLNPSSYGTISIVKNSGSGLIPLVGGEIVAGNFATVTYSATLNEFILQNPYVGTNVIEGSAYGVNGNGTFINNTAFNQMWAAAANGGKIHLACGTYKITTTPTVTVASGAHVDLNGDGSDCTIIFVSGAVNGPTFNYASQWSSVGIRGLTIETDQSGGTSCLALQGAFTNANPALSSASSIENVTFRGTDTFGAATKYCGNGLFEQSITNIAIFNLTFNGSASSAGTAVYLLGTSAANSDHINISHSNWDACATGVYYGDYVQGVQMTLDNVTGCGNGVITTSSATTSLSGLLISSSQFDTTSAGVYIADTAFPNLQLSNNQFIVEANSTGVVVQGTNFAIDASNEFNGHTTTGNTGVSVGSTYGNGGKIEGTFVGLGTGITILSTSSAIVKIDTPHMLNNTYDYAVFDTSGLIINDNYPRALSVITSLVPCNSATRYSRMLQADGSSPAYLATATSGGAEVVPLVCNGTAYKNH